MAVWPQVFNLAMLINERISRPVGTILVIVFAIAVVFSVVYALTVGAHQMPRHIESHSIFLRSLPGAGITIAGIIAAWRAYKFTAPGRVTFVIGLAPAVIAGVGLFNDIMSRAAAGIPINVGLIYLGIVGIFFFAVFSALRTR